MMREREREREREGERTVVAEVLLVKPVAPLI